MIKREISDKVLSLAKKFPIITITGPRQSGKTTLVRELFKSKPYFSLEDPDIRLIAETDPRGFLENLTNGAVLDEIQRVPGLFSYLQNVSDKKNKSGLFILSGSQNFLLMEKITQSLAGRAALFYLLPFSAIEIKSEIQKNISKSIVSGFYPRLYDKNIKPRDYYANYVQTYVERDLRQLKFVHDLSSFINFIKLCAGRAGQILNLSSLANDCGISVNTAKSWISILESSFIIYTLKQFHRNINKRLVKNPKLYFYDTGLLCYLLNISNQSELNLHYAKGAVFENFVINEFVKFFFNKGINDFPMYYLRNKTGNEIDLIIESGLKLFPIEIKSSKTFSPAFIKDIRYYSKVLDFGKKRAAVIYRGDNSFTYEDVNVETEKALFEIPRMLKS
ncbi:MAG: ATP-binding protein [Ignavibacteria bacterium]|nr:ATP-binding protein [Ignavibacteria bacterium]